MPVELVIDIEIKENYNSLLKEKVIIQDATKISFICKECNKKIIAKYMNVFVSEMRELDKLLRNIVYPYNIVEFCVKRIITSIGVGGLVGVVVISMGMGWITVFISIIALILSYYGQVLYIRVKKNIMLNNTNKTRLNETREFAKIRSKDSYTERKERNP